MTLSGPDLAEAIAKVGRPRSHHSTLIPVDVDKAKAMLETGFPWNQVGEYFGCSGMTIRRRLNGPKAKRTPPLDSWTTGNLPDLPWLPWLKPYK